MLYNENMLGNIHSFESFATLDGGGIRFEIFFQGCPLRCVYCHNVDTQQVKDNKLMSVQEIVAMIEKLKHYYVNGGVTISGGEPLLQSEFLLELIKVIKLLGLHVAIDTSLAIIPNNFDEILAHVDLFIVDLKFWDEKSYNKYCGGKLATVLDGIARIERANKKILLRTVIVPNINDTYAHMCKYFGLISCFKCIEKYELLGYHTMGAYKYAELSMVNPLENVPALDHLKLVELQEHLDSMRTNENEKK